MVGPGRRRPDRHRPRRGRLPVHARGPADPRLQQPADVGQHRPRRPAGGRRDHRPGDEARSTSSRRSRRRSGRGSGRSWPRSCPATWTRSSSRSAARRRSRTRSSSPAHATGRHKILARYRSYHGATLGAMTLTGDPRRWAERAGHRRRRPLPGHAPLGRGRTTSRGREPPGPRGRHPLRGRRRPSPRSSSRRSSGRTASSSRPTATSQGVREICDRNDILMVADEVMAGFGRTGRWFAVDHWDVTPDLMTMAKGLTSSYLPLGAVAMRHDVAEKFETQMFYGGLTYSSHPVSLAAALATIAVYEEDGLIEQRGPPRSGHARAPPAPGRAAPERRGDAQPRAVRDHRPRPQPRPVDAAHAVQRDLGRDEGDRRSSSARTGCTR